MLPLTNTERAQRIQAALDSGFRFRCVRWTESKGKRLEVRWFIANPIRAKISPEFKTKNAARGWLAEFWPRIREKIPPQFLTQNGA